jgi:hypothetical protein
MRPERQTNSRAAQDTEKIAPQHASPEPPGQHRISSNHYFDRG